MTEPAITPELVAKHNLIPVECAQAKHGLGGWLLRCGGWPGAIGT